jgi:hypothetical protein
MIPSRQPEDLQGQMSMIKALYLKSSAKATSRLIWKVEPCTCSVTTEPEVRLKE